MKGQTVDRVDDSRPSSSLGLLLADFLQCRATRLRFIFMQLVGSPAAKDTGLGGMGMDDGWTLQAMTMKL